MNKLDMMDAQARGVKKAQVRLMRAAANFNQPEIETNIGKMFAQAQAMGAQFPADVTKEMEARYGQDQIS